MSRPLPRYAPPEIVAGLHLSPAGAHELEIAVPSGIVGMKFGRDQVDQLERAIARYRERVAFEDGRSGEIRNPRFIPLEID